MTHEQASQLPYDEAMTVLAYLHHQARYNYEVQQAESRKNSLQSH